MKRLLLVLACISFASCTVYKTIDVPVSEESFRYYLPKAPHWTVQKGSDPAQYVVVDKVEADAITVTLRGPQVMLDHKPNKNFYWRHYGKYHLDHFHLTVPIESTLDTQTRIPFSNIQKAQTHAIDGVTVVSSIGTAMLYTVVGGAALAIIACNCPRVSVVGKANPTLDGALFPGAMSKSLSRHDNLLLRDVPVNDGQVQIRISNELPETEYIDQVELFELSNLTYTNVALKADGKPISFEPDNNRLISATTGIGTDIRDMISETDQVNYSFDDFESDDELNKIILKFSKPEQSNSILVIKARQSPWIETVGEFFFQQFGDAFPKWVDKLDKTDPARYNKNLRDRGISMNAYLKKNGEWTHVGSFENAGTIAGRDLAIPVNLTGLTGDVEIKLEAAHGMWEVDRVGLTSQWSNDVKLRKLNTLSATNNAQRDVLAEISSADEKYLEQPEHTSFVNIAFEAPSAASSVLMLSGTGYYHHLRNYKTKPNYKLLRKLDDQNISTHQLSRLMRAMSASNAPQK